MTEFFSAIATLSGLTFVDVGMLGTGVSLTVAPSRASGSRASCPSPRSYCAATAAT